MKLISEAQLKRIVRKEIKSFLREQSLGGVGVDQLVNFIDIDVDPSEARKIVSVVARKLDKFLKEDEEQDINDAREYLEHVRQEILSQLGSNPKKTILQAMLSNQRLVRKIKEEITKDFKLRNAILDSLSMAKRGSVRAAKRELAVKLKGWLYGKEVKIIELVEEELGWKFLKTIGIITMSVTSVEVMAHAVSMVVDKTIDLYVKLGIEPLSLSIIMGILLFSVVVLYIVSIILLGVKKMYANRFNKYDVDF